MDIVQIESTLSSTLRSQISTNCSLAIRNMVFDGTVGGMTGGSEPTKAHYVCCDQSFEECHF